MKMNQQTNSHLIETEVGITVEFECRFQQKKGRKKVGQGKTVHDNQPSKSALSIHRTTKLLALAHYYQKHVDDGIVKNYADIARLTGTSRARITQIINLTFLAPEIQKEIFFLNGKVLTSCLKEQDLRIVLKSLVWQEQIEIYDRLKTSRSLKNYTTP